MDKINTTAQSYQSIVGNSLAKGDGETRKESAIFSLGISQNVQNSAPHISSDNVAHEQVRGASASYQASQTLLRFQESQSQHDALTSPVLNTNKGYVNVDLDEYYSDDPAVRQNLLDTPLLLPSADNIAALSNHASARFKQLLVDYDIPEAPETITYNQEGKIQIPTDYPYADALTKALEENRGLARELRDINALSSHYVEIQKRVPFIEEMQAASTQAEIERIIEKYRYLLYDNQSYSSIALTFSRDGTVGVQADGSPVSFV